MAKNETVEKMVASAKSEGKKYTASVFRGMAAVAWAERGTPQYDRLMGRTVEPSGVTIAGMIYTEHLYPHPDAMSVTGGILLKGDERRAVAADKKLLAIGADGSPDWDRFWTGHQLAGLANVS